MQPRTQGWGEKRLVSEQAFSLPEWSASPGGHSGQSRGAGHTPAPALAGGDKVALGKSLCLPSTPRDPQSQQRPVTWHPCTQTLWDHGGRPDSAQTPPGPGVARPRSARPLGEEANAPSPWTVSRLCPLLTSPEKGPPDKAAVADLRGTRCPSPTGDNDSGVRQRIR